MSQYFEDTTYFRRDANFKDIIVNGIYGTLGSITLNNSTITMWPTGGGSGFTTWGQIQGTDPYVNTALADALNAKANSGDLTPLTNNLNTVSANLNTLSGNVLILSAYDIQNTLNLSYLSGAINDTHSDVMNIAVLSSNWNNTHDTVYNLSANWQSVYNSYHSTSGFFLTSVDLTNYALNSSLSAYVPTTRNITINGDTQNLTADPTWNIVSMVYPSSGITVSNGSAWMPSITGSSIQFVKADGSLDGTSYATVGDDVAVSTLVHNTSGMWNDTSTVVQTNSAAWTSGSTSLSSTYLKLDTTNGPLSGDLGITKASPELRLTDNTSDYMRMVRTPTANTGSLYNRITKLAGVGKAVSFLTSTGITIPDSDSFTFNNGVNDLPFSISLFVYITGAGSGYSVLFGKSTSFAGTGEYILVYNSGVVTLMLLNNGVGTINISRVSTSVAQNAWKHIVVTYNGSGLASGINIYINGALANGATGGAGVYTGMTNTTKVLSIGNSSEVTGSYLQGSIDEVIIFNKALSLAEVGTLYNSGNGAYGDGGISNCIAGWHLDEAVGTSCTDFTGNGNTGTFVGSPSWATGVVTMPSSQYEAIVINSGDSIVSFENGKHTFGDYNGRTIIDGVTTRFNVNGVEKGQISSTAFSQTIPHIITGSSDATQLKIVQNATQTNDVFQILASDGTTVRLSQDSKGYLKIINSTGANNVMILGGTNGVPASQTGNFNTVMGDKAFKAATSGASNAIFGYNAGALLNSGGSNIFLGANAGSYQTTAGNYLLIDNVTRGSAALDLTGAIIYGQMNATAANQILTVNGSLVVAQATGLSTITRGVTINNGSTSTDATDAFTVKSPNQQYLIYTKPSTDRIGICTNAPLSVLDITSTTGTLIVARMTTTQKNAMTGVNGMIVYDSTLNKFQGFEAGSWVSLI